MKNKNNSPVNIRFVAKISDIRKLFENIRFDVKSGSTAAEPWSSELQSSSELLVPKNFKARNAAVVSLLIG